MKNTTTLRKFLEENGFWADMVGDMGAKDGCCLILNINKEHFFTIYLEDNDSFIVRVDGSRNTVECATNEIVLNVIKMAIFCGGWK